MNKEGTDLVMDKSHIPEQGSTLSRNIAGKVFE